MATRKIDLFQASKELSARTNEFMTATVWAAIINARYQRDVEKLNQKIENAESLRGSILDVDDHVDTLIATYQQELKDLSERHQSDLEKQGKFALNDAEKAFYEDYKKAGVDIRQPIVDFLKGYKLDVVGTDLLDVLVYAISGRKAASGKKVIKSGATTFTTTRTKQDVLRTLYGVLTEKMIVAGTLKIVAIPADVRKLYEKKGNK